ncbi:DivIVA domain-containing protein [Antrihabitans cavernicola]|uniref:Cell wall synthesis protein Wag31 n=1 Tax=Antrihabitans cavernicola TaxID=2495913 RepID=A0A5A7S263_9NOCA|nr:DivIVA domain-containing protein [Spelaeibacter cavernicola]KAA0017017.1 DivIVA domain-containing protein [Spelaeibacter cavernicola]
MALTPSEIHRKEFKRSPLGRRGYDENDVDDFLDAVGADVAGLLARNARLVADNTRLAETTDIDTDAENDRLIARVRTLEWQLHQLHQLHQRGTAVGGGAAIAGVRAELAAVQRENARLRAESEQDLLGVSVRAVNLLSQAQVSADATIGEAELYARDLVLTAREQYREILRRAQRSAAETADGLTSLTQGSGANYSRPIPEIEYVRTHARIAQNQLRAIVTALSTEIDKLGDLPHLDSPPVAAALPAAASPALPRHRLDRSVRTLHDGATDHPDADTARSSASHRRQAPI